MQLINPSFFIIFFFIICISKSANAQEIINKRTYRTEKVQGRIVVDGIFEEEAWSNVGWSSNFTEQAQPIDETSDTQFKIIYDEHYLYVAIKCLDPSPDSIPLYPSPRDNPSNDWVEVDFDSSYDGTTAYAFVVSPYGVRTDMYITGDDENFDDRWHPKWEVKTSIQKDGWYAEMKIPFDQMELASNTKWGLQVTRRVKRKNQYTNWQAMPKGTKGWVSQFGELKGIEDFHGKISPEHIYEVSKKIDADALRQDFRLFRKTLEHIYPDLYWFTSKKELDGLFDTTYQSINSPLTEFEFYEKLTPILNKIGDGHSWIRPSRNFINHVFNTYKLLPLGVLAKGDSVYITKNFGADSTIIKGMQILAINDIAVHEILPKLRCYISADGYNETWKTDRVSNNFSYYLSHLLGSQEIFKLKVLLPNTADVKVISVLGLKEANWTKNSLEENNFPLRKGNWNYKKIDTSIGYLAISTFARGSRFRNFMDETFAKIASDTIDDLIIDLRDNYGGNDINGSYLYSYLASEPFYYYKEYEVNKVLDSTITEDIDCCISMEEFDFLSVTSKSTADNRRIVFDFENTGYMNPNEVISPQPNAFAGDVYLIVNGGSFSVTSDFASKFHEMNRGPIIGEETGGGYYGNTSGINKLLVLPNSGLRVNLNLIKYVNNRDQSNHPFGSGVLPEHEVTPTQLQIANGIDAELQWLIQYLKSKK